MRLLGTLLTLLLFLTLALALGAGLALDAAPSVTESSRLTPRDLRRARQTVNEIRDAAADGQVATLRISENDIDLLLDYLLSMAYGGSSSSELSEGTIRLRASTQVPENVFGAYLNSTLTFRQNAELLELTELRVGAISLPSWLSTRLMAHVHAQLRQRVPEYAALLDSVHGVSIGPDSLELSYSLQPALLEQLSSRGRQLLLSEETSARLLAHADHLETLSEGFEAGGSLGLPELLGPMMDFAARRSDEPVEENRAAIQVLALYMMDLDPGDLLQGTSPGASSRERLRLTLYRRYDIAQHFLGSAAIAVTTEPGLAESIAVLKEMDDSREGSGFSFTDLAADRAGIRFAELAVADAQSARRVQELLRRPFPETTILFDIRDLPEFLTEAEFRDRYGDASSPAYRAVEREIEDRIAQTPLYRETP